MSILSTNHRLVSIGESYSAGNGIDITDQVISVTGDDIPYSAGENIDIQDHIISGKDWSNDITEASSHAYNETTAWVKENYANSADMTYISAMVDTKLDTSAWSSVSGDLATESYVIMSDNITYDRAKGYVDSQQFAKESACQSAFDYLNTNKLDNISFTNWQNGQYTTDIQTIEGQINNKLDESAFSQVSGDFLTAINIPESATWNEVSQVYEQASATYLTSVNIPESAVWQDVSTTVQSNSAQWAEGGAGDEEVNSFVYNNSASIKDVNSSYKTYSSTFLTALPSDLATTGDLDSLSRSIEDASANAYNEAISKIPDPFDSSYISGQVDNKLDATAFAVWQDGQYITDLQTIGGLISYKLDSSSFSTVSGDFLTAINIPASAVWQDVSTTVQTNSAQWAEGVSIPVSNSGNLYKVEFDGIDLYGYKSSTTIDSEAVYSSLSSEESTDIQITVTPSWNNNAFGYFNWVGFDVISISSNGSEIYPSGYENNGLTALNVYYKADWLYNNNNEPLPPFSGYIGKITLDNLFISSYIDKPSYFNEIKRCDEFKLWFSGNYINQDIISKYICSVGTYVQSEPRTFEGIFVIPQSALPTYEYDSTNKISAINGSALAGGGEVPTGTMNVSGLEFNAVNEISAYNGSAIHYPDSSALLPYPMEFVSTSGEATGTNILYVVTGTGE